MGFFDPFKKSRRQVNRENQSQGKDGEEQVRRTYEFNGYEVKRTGKGHDFKATKRDWLTGKKQKPVYIEAKTNSSRLSKLQKQKKRRLGKRYVVERLESTAFGLVHETSALGSKSGLYPKKPKTKKSNPLGNSTSLWGLGSSQKKPKTKKRKTKTKTTKKKSGSLDFGVSFWGTSSTKKSKTKKKPKAKTSKRKKKSGSADFNSAFWGSSSTGKKSRRKKDDWSIW